MRTIPRRWVICGLFWAFTCGLPPSIPAQDTSPRPAEPESREAATPTLPELPTLPQLPTSRRREAQQRRTPPSSLFDLPEDDGALFDLGRDETPATPGRASPGSPDPIRQQLEAFQRVREKMEEEDHDLRHPNNVPRSLEHKLPEMGSIRPPPPMRIPDDPPPHEGAMIDVPITVEPPDLLLIEVLEALPGRPITGECLVRPDGTVSLGFYGSIHVRGLTAPQIKTKVVLHLRQYLPDDALGLCGVDENGNFILVMPEDSDRIFVDVAAYNSHVYYVQGDVGAPGRLPITGQDTVLDALNYAGILTPTANPGAITLHRPARGDQPAMQYAIDLEAIQKGDSTRNLQLFPNDRIFVGRDPIVQATLKIDRVYSPLRTVLESLRLAGYATQSLNTALKDSPISAEQRSGLIRDYVEFWWTQANRPEGEPLDEEAFKAELRRLLDASIPREPE